MPRVGPASGGAEGAEGAEKGGAPGLPGLLGVVGAVAGGVEVGDTGTRPSLAAVHPAARAMKNPVTTMAKVSDEPRSKMFFMTRT